MWLGYISYRWACNTSGKSAAQSWADLEDLIRPTAMAKLKAIYQHPDDVDLFVGGSLEKGDEGAMLGPTFRQGHNIAEAIY